MKIPTPLLALAPCIVVLASALPLPAQPPAPIGPAYFSTWAYPGTSGRITHKADWQGNRLLDNSAVGYRFGTAPIPDVPVKVTLSPVAGDDGAQIQAAIDQVEAMPLDANGFRGAVFLNAGEYQINGTITINGNGVVLRGAGDGTNETVLRATGTSQRSLFRITGSGSASTVAGTTHTITDIYVPVGARSFNVDSTSGLAAGDRVFVQRRSNTNWINEIGMNLLDNPWGPFNLDMDRLITRIEGNRIFINSPITTAIQQIYNGGTIRKYTWATRNQNVGIEDLRGVSDFVGPEDEAHGWIFIQVNSTEHGWVRNVTSQHFGYACVALYSGTRHFTVRNCRSLDPVSEITGGRRYAFVMDDNQHCLVENCYTDEDRHQFVTQSQTTGPNVFVDGLSDSAKSDAGPHHRWGNGATWDNVTINGHNLNIQNRGNSGSGHGWAGANCLVWNSDADGGYVVQMPPTAHNWLIGSKGNIETGGGVGPHDPGIVELHGTNVFPHSLYYAQLQDRLGAPNLETREYWFGDIDRFAGNTSTGDVVTVDSTWRSTVQSAAGGAALRGFDHVAGNQWIPFTINYAVSTNDRIIGATLTLAMRAAGPGASDDVLYLDSLGNSFTFASLNWTPITTTTNTSVRVVDLGAQLGLLADGRLNVAVQNDVGIDWALLELHVAPAMTAFTNSLAPVADAHVRGGAGAGSNFGNSTTLSVKEDSSADNDRKAYLRWDLGGVSGTVLHARIRLQPVMVETNALEHGATLAGSDTWTESGITWNNQPNGGKRFATWLASTSRPAEFVVTPQVLEALAGDKQLSLQISALRNSGVPGLVDYASSEHPTPASRPQLILVTSTPQETPNPLGLIDADIGGVNPAGSSSFADGTFTIRGGGNDIWGTNDQCHFTCKPVTNDFEIVARVTALDDFHAWIKAGVMIRESLNGNSRQVMTSVTPSNGVNFFYRAATGGTTASAGIDGPVVPAWVKLVRSGNSFSSWFSTDGVNWTQIGSTQNIPMTSVVLAGLALSSHVVGTLATATMDNVAIQAPAVDFALSATPASQTVTAGNTSSYAVNVTGLGGFGGNVSLSVSGLPAGASASFSPGSVSGSGSSTLSITTSSTTPAGDHTLTITGTSGTLAHSATVTLSVNNFSVSATPATQPVTAGGTASYTVNVASFNGFAGTVSLSASGLPAGASAVFNPSSVAGPGSSTLTIATSGSTPAGNHSVTITGNSGGLTRTATVTLSVNNYSLAATPASQTVTAGQNTSYSVTVAGVNGFGGNVTFSLTGLPPGASGSFNPASISGPGSSTLSVTTGAGTPAGNHPLTVVGTSGTLTRSTPVALVVNAPNPALLYEAELIPRTSTGAALNVVADGLASNGQWVSLLATNVGPFVEYTLTNVPPGTYGLSLIYKRHQNRGIHTLSLDGVQMGGALNQFGTNIAFVTQPFGNVTFTAPGNHLVRLMVTGKDAAAGNHNISADAFRLTSTNETWLSQDIGAVGLAGSFSQNGNQFTVAGSGSDIWTAADQFRYAYQYMSGDFEIIARVASLQQTHAFAKAGVMIRQSLATNSAHASVLLTPTNGVSLHVRPTTGASTINVTGWIKPATPPHWVRLTRVGNTFTAFHSANGSTWTQLAQTNVTMSAGVTAGMAVTSHNNSALTTAVLE